MTDFSIVNEFITFIGELSNQIMGYIGNFVSFAIQVGMVIIIAAIIGIAFRVIAYVFGGRRVL